MTESPFRTLFERSNLLFVTSWPQINFHCPGRLLKGVSEGNPWDMGWSMCIRQGDGRAVRTTNRKYAKIEENLVMDSSNSVQPPWGYELLNDQHAITSTWKFQLFTSIVVCVFPWLRSLRIICRKYWRTFIVEVDIIGSESFHTASCLPHQINTSRSNAHFQHDNIPPARSTIYLYATIQLCHGPFRRKPVS